MWRQTMRISHDIEERFGIPRPKFNINIFKQAAKLLCEWQHIPGEGWVVTDSSFRRMDPTKFYRAAIQYNVGRAQGTLRTDVDPQEMVFRMYIAQELVTATGIPQEVMHLMTGQ